MTGLESKREEQQPKRSDSRQPEPAKQTVESEEGAEAGGVAESESPQQDAEASA